MSELITQNEEVRKILKQCALSTRVTAKTLFAELFSAPFSLLHDQIFKLIDDPTKMRIALAAPRGIGKTTICRTHAKRSILFRENRFVVYVSCSATSAEMQTENIKRELLTNNLIKNLFGSIKVSDYDSDDESFSKKAWVAFGHTFILPRGAGQQVRGLNWAGYRPELVIIDDLEDKETVKSDEQRAKLKEWFFSDLMKTEDKYGKPTKFIYIDTIKHEDSLLQLLLESSDWESLRLSICDENYNSYDPNYMTTEEIKAEVEEHRQKGIIDLFYMERMNLPISAEDAVFKNSYFKYFRDEGTHLRVYEKDKEELVPTYNLMNVVIVDPAKTVQLHSAESAVVVISVDRETHRIFVRDIISQRVRPDELYENMFSAVIRFNARILAVEVTSLHQFISQPIENEMRVRGIYPFYLELKAIGKKEDRIASLAPNYRLGYMYHNKDNCGALESQLLSFPRSKLWDVMDATGYITKVMDDLAYYFDPPDLDSQEPDAEYAELDNDTGLVYKGIV